MVLLLIIGIIVLCFCGDKLEDRLMQFAQTTKNPLLKHVAIYGLVYWMCGLILISLGILIGIYPQYTLSACIETIALIFVIIIFAKIAYAWFQVSKSIEERMSADK